MIMNDGLMRYERIWRTEQTGCLEFGLLLDIACIRSLCMRDTTKTPVSRTPIIIYDRLRTSLNLA